MLTQGSQSALSMAAGQQEYSSSLLNKVLRDPYYGPTYMLSRSLESVLDAGFFNDGEQEIEAGNFELRAGHDWLMTPFHKVQQRLSLLAEGEARPLIVLLSTGAYCPPHSGHLRIMEIAKDELERRGCAVLGGYLSPSHDGYVQPKCGGGALDAAHRLCLCHEMVRDSDWLMADGWEALGCRVPLNFTDVMARLEAYLAEHITSPRPIEVAYVFGSDNARFARAFLAKGRCVCVLRPGAEERFVRYNQMEGVASCERLVFAATPSYDLSSTRVRNGSAAVQHVACSNLYTSWTTAPERERGQTHYYMRDEGQWAFSDWLEGRDPGALNSAWSELRDGVMDLVKQAHLQIMHPDVATEVTFAVQRLEDQRSQAARMNAGDKVISLDPCIEGDINLGVARRFAVSAPGSFIKMGTRPGSASLEAQIAGIPDGDYVLFDDDIATGGTMRWAQSLLPERIRIKEARALTSCRKADDGRVVEILDCRDFLAGAREGGLVVHLGDGTLARAPYCLPYVSPADRASLPVGSELEFSRQLWLLNERFFNAQSTPILLGEASAFFQRLVRRLPFCEATPMSEVCRWHSDRCRPRN